MVSDDSICLFQLLLIWVTIVLERYGQESSDLREEINFGTIMYYKGFKTIEMQLSAPEGR